MATRKFQIYPYRWAVLAAFMMAIAVNQLLWITFAPITSEAVSFFQVPDLSIGLLSMSFMIVYILVSFPASWMIDKYGIRIAVGIGVILTGIFGLVRGLVAWDFTLVLMAQIIIAIGQPFILNAITTVTARWFPMEERATAAGLGTLAMYLGILLGMVLTPLITIQTGIKNMLVIYGMIAMVIGVIFFIFVREKPPSPPCPPGQEVRSLIFDGFTQALRNRNFIILMSIFFVGLGAFNAITTWIEDILNPRGFSIIEAGYTGGMMIVGGILGALILPILSDRKRKRIPYLITAVVGATIGLVGVIFAAPFWLLLASAFIFGFFLLSAGPIGFQYGAEITHPAPEGMSNGVLLLMGQISGIVFILSMDIFKSSETGSMTLPLLFLTGLMLVALILAAQLKEPKAFLTNTTEDM